MQLAERFLRVLGPCLHRACGEMGNELRDRRIDAGAGPSKRGHILMHMLEHERHGIVGSERNFAGKHLPGHDAHRVQVALRGGLIVLDHLRRKIGGGAQQHAGGGQRGLRCGPGQAEIGDLHMAPVVEQNVLRLDIAVDYAGAMCRRKPVKRLGDDTQRLAHAESALRVHFMAQIDAVDVLHHQAGEAFVFAGVVDLHDMGVRDGSRRFGLAVESLDELVAMRALGQLRVHDLDGDGAFEPLVKRLIDRGHAAVGDFAHDAIASLDQLPFGRVCGFSHGGVRLIPCSSWMSSWVMRK